MLIRPSGRSTDFISPSFGHGCLYNCTYCYMKRHKPTGLSIAENTEAILQAIDNHVMQQEWPKPPNQCDPIYWTYDIGCNEDFALHAKYHDWKQIFKFFKNHPRAKASFATKHVQPLFRDFNPNKKVRIRASLLSIPLWEELEPETSTPMDRIYYLKDLFESGYETHVNFSPVVVYENGLHDYKEIFNALNELYADQKPEVKAEVIFLTHNEDKHNYNLQNNLPGEYLLWNPKMQETKISQYGGKNLRYKRKYKGQMIQEFLKTMYQEIPWCKIRYAF